MPGRIWSGRTLGVVVCVVALVGGCSSSGGDDVAESASANTTTSAAEATTTTAPQTLDILVSNDDGYQGEGLDAVVQALIDLPDTNVTVSAPAEDRTGTGGQSTDGTLTATDEETLSGYPATAVQGFPADSVNYALDEVLDAPPDVVITGLNAGQNMGPLIDASGTIGAARAAVAAGIPALATSQGIDADPPDYDSGVQFVLDWVAENRDALVSGEAAVEVTNLNIPSCTASEVRGLVEVPAAADMAGREYNTADCTSTEEDPPDDVGGFNIGFATIGVIPDTPAAG